MSDEKSFCILYCPVLSDPDPGDFPAAAPGRGPRSCHRMVYPAVRKPVGAFQAGLLAAAAGGAAAYGKKRPAKAGGGHPPMAGDHADGGACYLLGAVCHPARPGSVPAGVDYSLRSGAAIVPAGSAVRRGPVDLAGACRGIGDPLHCSDIFAADGRAVSRPLGRGCDGNDPVLKKRMGKGRKGASLSPYAFSKQGDEIVRFSIRLPSHISYVLSAKDTPIAFLPFQGKRQETA